jgi:hypothetical protein
MNIFKYYILKDKEIVETNFDEYGKYIFNTDKVINKTVISKNVKVSTVFLSLDHRISGEGKPILFETMVFGGEFDLYQRRYTSYKEAEWGHEIICKMVKGELDGININYRNT